MKYSVTILEAHWEELLGIIFSKLDLEGAAYLLCGISSTQNETRLLVREVIPVKDEHYLKREPLRLCIASDSYVPVAKKAKEEKLSVLFVHSHPEGVPEFSPQDDREEPKLLEFFKTRAPGGTHGAMVINAPDSCAARISGESTYEVFRVRVVGKKFRFIDRQQSGELPIPPFFDRQVRAFGPLIQRLLSRLHVGVVGAGGTGSAVFEQLSRLGVGAISVFDHDTFDDSNVNRVYGSGVSDKGELKVRIAQNSAVRIGVGTAVHVFEKGIGFESSARALRECDVVFSCTDTQAPRSILTQLSIRYLIPMFDMGAQIESEGGVLEGVYRRVTTFFPEEACLFCRNRITSDGIRLESLKEEERVALAKEGYAPELETNAPAVIPFTTAVATQAISEFLHRLTGFMGEERLTTEILFFFHETGLKRNRQSASPHCVCSQKKLWGRGDTKHFLDISWPSELQTAPK